jgi:hypothetical protein
LMGWGELAVSMSSGEGDPEAAGGLDLGRFAVVAVLLMVYAMVRGDAGLSVVFFTLATFLYVLDIRRRPRRLSFV